MSERIKLTKEKLIEFGNILHEINDERITHSMALAKVEEYERIQVQILEDQQNADLFLNETCGYCKEKMIVIESRHVHACKHDLIDTDNTKIIDENKQLRTQNIILKGNITYHLHKKLEKIERDYEYVCKRGQEKGLKIQNLEQKLEKIKKELHSFYEDDTNFVDFTAKLKAILEDKS